MVQPSFREGDTQHGQHFQHRRVLLHVLLAEPGKAAAGKLLRGEVIQRLVDSGGHVLSILIGCKSLYGLRRQQDILKAVRVFDHALIS